MSIEKLEEFAKSGEKHLNGISTELGFSSSEKPERQWFNYLFNDISIKTNQVIDSLSDVTFNFTDYEAKVLALEENYEGIGSEISAVSSNFQNADSVLQSQINSVGGGKKAYTTYAKMVEAAALPVGDPLKLPANSSVDVTNDTDSTKNGMYAYNGTAFTKSAYDPVALAATDATTKANNAKTQAVADSKTYTDTVTGQLKSSIDVNSNEPIFETKDSTGATTFKQTADGNLHAVVVGDLTQTVLDSKNGEGEQRLNNPTVQFMGKYADAKLLQNMQSYNQTAQLLTYTEVNALGVFHHAVNRLRIPAITRIAQNKYLLCFEARIAIDDFAETSLGTAIITVDNTTKLATVSNIQSVHNSFVDGEGKRRNFLEGVTVRLDSGRLILIYFRRHERIEHELYMRTSDDGGVTWSNFTDISYVKNNAGLNVLAVCSQGLVKRYGQHKGRIIFPAWTTGPAYESEDYRAGYIYSDDEGATWDLGEFCDYAGSNEVQIAEYLNGDMMFSIRLLVDENPRVMLRHYDVTKRFVDIQTDNLALGSEAIMSGLIQGDNKFDLTPNKFQLTAAKDKGRKELYVHTSYDGGETWLTHLLQSTVGQWVAYSCIERLDVEHNFVLWESNSESNFSYAVISLNELVGSTI